jgi:hypothetical protein
MLRAPIRASGENDRGYSQRDAAANQAEAVGSSADTMTKAGQNQAGRDYPSERKESNSQPGIRS